MLTQKKIPPDLLSPEGSQGFKIKRRGGGRQVSLAVLGYSKVTGIKSAPSNPPKPASQQGFINTPYATPHRQRQRKSMKNPVFTGFLP